MITTFEFRNEQVTYIMALGLVNKASVLSSDSVVIVLFVSLFAPLGASPLETLPSPMVIILKVFFVTLINA